MSGIGKIVYIKISRTDGNGVDITNSLESLEKIVIPLSTGNKSFSILNRTKEPQYFLFYVSMAGTEDIPAIDKSSPEYIFTGSVNNNVNSFSIFPSGIPVTESLYDSLNIYNSSVESYQIPTLPAKIINVRFSGSVIESTPSIGTSSIGFGAGPSLSPLSFTNLGTQQIVNDNSTSSFNISISIPINTITPGDYIFPIGKASAGGRSMKFLPGTKFFISSSNAVVNPKDMSVEPYFTSPYYGTDCDVMYGDVSQGVSNPFFQDIDYSEGIVVPTNYIALRDNIATKAVVPESMFTIDSLINPGYSSKNQSEKINEWTNSANNIGTYGKTSPVSSLESLVVYCDWIGGTTPELNDQSAAHVKYIILEDGTIKSPNLDPTTIIDVQHAFSNGNLEVSLINPPVGQGMEILNGIKKITKGGYRVEPILYSQIPTAPFSSSITLQTQSLLPIEDIRFQANEFYSANIFQSSDSSTKLSFNNQVFDKLGNYDPSTSLYTVDQDTIDSGVNAVFWFNIVQSRIGNFGGSSDIGYQLIKNSGSVSQEIVGEQFFPNVSSISFDINFGSFNIQNNNLVLNDTYCIFINPTTLGSNSTNLYYGDFTLEQTPVPTGDVNISVVNPIWGYSSSIDLSILSGSQDNLNNNYDFYQQEPIANSGFFTPTNLFSILPGDQFRFEDDESKVYNVQRVIPPNENSDGKIIVYLDRPVSTSINKNYFLIRRFVEDGSFIIFDQAKPASSSGTSLIKPQYVTQTLTKGVDEYILDLTDKGLIT